MADAAGLPFAMQLHTSLGVSVILPADLSTKFLLQLFDGQDFGVRYYRCEFTRYLIEIFESFPFPLGPFV